MTLPPRMTSSPVSPTAAGLPSAFTILISIDRISTPEVPNLWRFGVFVEMTGRRLGEAVALEDGHAEGREELLLLHVQQRAASDAELEGRAEDLPPDRLEDDQAREGVREERGEPGPRTAAGRTRCRSRRCRPGCRP